MAWDFTADSDIQTEVSTKLNDLAGQYEGKVAEMYGKIGEMGSYWEGDDYDLFVTGTDGYKTALQDLSNSIKMYSVHFGNMATGTEQLATDLIAIVEDLTGAAAAAAAGNGPLGGQGGQGGACASAGQGGQGGQCGSSGQGGQGGQGGQCGSAGQCGSPGQGQCGSSGQGQNGNGQNPQGTPGAAGPLDTNGDGSVSLGEKVGSRYADDWNDFTQDVSNRWDDAHGLVTGVGAAAFTVVEGADMIVDGAIDTVLTAVDTVDYGANWLLDVGTGRGGSTSNDYWQNIGTDYSENWNTLANADNFLEGTWGVIEGTGRTIVDAGQTVINAADEAIDWVGNAAGDVVDWIGDAAGTVWSWIF